MASYDVIIIGAGPGGYVCAIRCAQLGLKTAVVEGRETLGGTCLNVGCIPSKALLHATHMLHEAEHNFAGMGLKGKSPSVDWKQMLAYKDDVIGQNTGGIEFLFKKNKIDWIKGWASIPEAGKVKVGDAVHEAKNIVIATGSEPSSIPNVAIDEDRIVSSTGALALPKVPKKMIVIGAGVIGLELGSVYARLGAEVTVVEYMDAVLPGMDADVQRLVKRLLEKQGLEIVTGAAVQWMRDQLGLFASAAEIEALAESVPDSGGVVFVPAFAGLGAPHWDPYARGTLLGLTRGSHRGHIARATLEAIACQSSEVLSAMEQDSGIRLEELRVDGGATRNHLLMQIQSDLLGVPVVRSAIAETTAQGAAYLAGLASGVWSDREEIAAQWAESGRYLPMTDRSAAAKQMATWSRAVDRAKGWAEPD